MATVPTSRFPILVDGAKGGVVHELLPCDHAIAQLARGCSSWGGGSSGGWGGSGSGGWGGSQHLLRGFQKLLAEGELFLFIGVFISVVIVINVFLLAWTLFGGALSSATAAGSGSMMTG